MKRISVATRSMRREALGTPCRHLLHMIRTACAVWIVQRSREGLVQFRALVRLTCYMEAASIWQAKMKEGSVT